MDVLCKFGHKMCRCVIQGKHDIEASLLTKLVF